MHWQQHDAVTLLHTAVVTLQPPSDSHVLSQKVSRRLQQLGNGCSVLSVKAEGAMKLAIEI